MRRKKMIEWIPSIITGIISGIIASIIFFVILLFIRPNVKISDNISCRSLDDNHLEYKIKILNKSMAMLSNVQYTLYFCKEGKDGMHTMEVIPPRKKPLTSLAKYGLYKKNIDYAMSITYDIDPIQYTLTNNSKLIFVLVCNHSLSNTTTCIQKEYRKSNIIEGIFETDKSMKVLEREE